MLIVHESRPRSETEGRYATGPTVARAGSLANRFTAIVLLVLLGSISSPAPCAGAAEDARAKVALGWSSFVGEDWPAAEQAFREAIDLDPSLAEAYRGLAETLLRQGSPEAAEQAILEGIPHLPSDTSTLSPFAEILARNRETRDGAIQIYRRLLAQAPGDQGTRLDLARNLAWTGRHREAIEECRLVHDGTADPETRYQARLLEAWVQSWRGDAKASLPIFRALAAERPEDPEPRLGIADSLAWTGRTRTAAAEYESILADFPSPEAWVGLGDLSRWEGRYFQAEADYLRALDLRPEDSRARAALASSRRESSVHLSFVPARFRDSTDWERDSFPLFVDFLRKRPVSLRAGVARIRYQQGDGQQVDRTSIPLQAFWRPGPQFSGAAGIARNEYSEGPDSTSYFLHGFFAPGGDLVRFRVGFDHYDMIDNYEPFTENFYNQPESIDVVRLGIELDEAWAGLLLPFTRPGADSPSCKLLDLLDQVDNPHNHAHLGVPILLA